MSFELSEGDKHHPIWIRLKEHFEKQLDLARRDNDHHVDAEKTAAIRGRIDCLKAIIRLGDDRPIVDRR